MIKSTKVEEIMTKNFFTVSLEDTIHKADRIIRTEKLRQIPVLDGKKFVGLISERKLNEYQLKGLYDFDDEFGEEGHDKIIDFQNIMSKDVFLIYPEDSVRKAIEIMAKKELNNLPVIDWKNNLLGIVTSRDIFLFLLNKVF